MAKENDITTLRSSSDKACMAGRRIGKTCSTVAIGQDALKELSSASTFFNFRPVGFYRKPGEEPTVKMHPLKVDSDYLEHMKIVHERGLETSLQTYADSAGFNLQKAQQEMEDRVARFNLEPGLSTINYECLKDKNVGSSKKRYSFGNPCGEIPLAVSGDINMQPADITEGRPAYSMRVQKCFAVFEALVEASQYAGCDPFEVTLAALQVIRAGSRYLDNSVKESIRNSIGLLNTLNDELEGKSRKQRYSFATMIWPLVKVGAVYQSHSLGYDFVEDELTLKVAVEQLEKLGAEVPWNTDTDSDEVPERPLSGLNAHLPTGIGTVGERFR